MKIITNYINSEIIYNFLNKDDLENEDFQDRPSQKKKNLDNDTEDLAFLSLFKEEIMHFSIDKLFIRCLNLDLTADKENIRKKYIGFEINKLKLTLNTEKLARQYKPEKEILKAHTSDRPFHILDISLIFSGITICIFKNISIVTKIDEAKREHIFDFTIQKIEVKAMKEKQHFFLCPFSKPKENAHNFFKKKTAFIMELKIIDSKLKKTTLKLCPISISLSTQKTNAILQTLNVLLEMNKHEYQLYKKYLKKEVMKSSYKQIIKNNRFELSESYNNFNSNNDQANNFLITLKSDKAELPKISIGFKKIFLILSKNEEVLIFTRFL